MWAIKLSFVLYLSERRPVRAEGRPAHLQDRHREGALHDADLWGDGPVQMWDDCNSLLQCWPYDVAGMTDELGYDDLGGGGRPRDGRRGPKRPRTILTAAQRRQFKASFEIQNHIILIRHINHLHIYFAIHNQHKFFEVWLYFINNFCCPIR